MLRRGSKFSLRALTLARPIPDTRLQEQAMAATDQLEPIEKASVDELRALQLVRLRGTLMRSYDHVPHYRKKFEAAGVHPTDLRAFADLGKFPFTTKEDLRLNYPFGMFAVPM